MRISTITNIVGNLSRYASEGCLSDPLREAGKVIARLSLSNVRHTGFHHQVKLRKEPKSLKLCNFPCELVNETWLRKHMAVATENESQQKQQSSQKSVWQQSSQEAAPQQSLQKSASQQSRQSSPKSVLKFPWAMWG